MLATTTTTAHPSPRWSFSLFNTHIEFRSMFMATLLLFLFLCLAYLSNPSETSFRSYLTEQSFRHHLSRLDDPTDPDHADSESSKSNYHSSSSPPPPTCGSLESGSSAFHFSNRAAIALRTPRHAFHSFGFFTVAAVIPNLKAHPSSRASSVVSSSRNTTGAPDHDLLPFKEAWFVGAFGRWWRGGVVDPAWPPHPSSPSSEEGWSSGILNIKALDRLEDFKGLPFPTTTHNPRTPQRSAPPRLRSRDRSTSRLRRSSTPPPLPKSAVLPLHTPKHNQSLTTSQPPPAHQRPQPQHHPSSPPTNDAIPNGSSPNFDSAPAVAELTQQIDQTRALNLELSHQLSEHTKAATAADVALDAELSSVREAKRVEDVARVELKARTKALEDSRRAAEAGKRDAERRLRATQKAKAEAGTRIEKLGEEIRVLEAQVQQDEVATRAADEAAAKEELDIQAQVKQRKREVSAAEEVVTALNVRVRELEESIDRERIALAAAREKAEALQREQDNNKYSFGLRQPLDTWEPISATEFTLTNPTLESRMGHEALDPFPTPLEKDSDRECGASGSISSHSSPHLRAPTTMPPINIGFGTPSQAHLHPVGASDSLARLAKGYSIFDGDLASLPDPIQASKFSPFGDSDVANGRRPLPLMQNGLTQSLDGTSTSTTAGDIETPEEMLSKRFQSDHETFPDHDWRPRLSIPDSVSGIGSDSHGHIFPHVDDDATETFESIEIRPPSHHRIASDLMNVPRMWSSRANSDPAPPPMVAAAQQEVRTRWWQSSDKERRSTIDGAEPRRGLNPDAKVFSFSAKPMFGMTAAPAFDSRNPSTPGFLVSGGASSSGTSSSGDSGNGNATTASSTPGFFSGLAMRAFAPSPAEREALHRALGGSTNTSLERLPSLSEVGTMQTSPVLTQSPAHPGASGNSLGLPWSDIGPGAGAGRNWLRELGVSMPRPGKIKFSPWGDGDGDGKEADK